jgi:hypothetical protein
MYTLGEFLLPGDRVNIGGPAYPNFELIDAAKVKYTHTHARNHSSRPSRLAL